MINSTQVLNTTTFSDATLKRVADKKTEKGKLLELSTYQAFKETYPDSESVFQKIFDVMRYKANDQCICGFPVSRFYQQVNKWQFKCKMCKLIVSPLASTPLAKCHYPLDKILEVAYLSYTSKHGLTAAEIRRLYGCKHETSLAIHWRVMIWMGMVSQGYKFNSGDVEVDETFCRIPSFLPKGVKLTVGLGSERITPVVTIVQRNGTAKAQLVDEATSTTIIPFVQDNVTKDATIHTDGKKLYRYLGKNGYKHQECNHSKKEWAVEGSHTNTCEALHGLIKHKIGPLHKGVSLRHLQKYCDESTFLFSHRNALEAINSLFQALPALNASNKIQLQ